MAENSAIEWTDHTFNPWIGCTKVSPACDNCYAEALMDTRYGRVEWGAGNDRSRTAPSTWRQPRKWNKLAAISGYRPFVFCASLADVFDNEVDERWRADLFDLIEATPNLIWLLLTKRIGNLNKMTDPARGCRILPRNTAVGATMANQEEYDRDRMKLAEVKMFAEPLFTFGSFEPLLGPVVLDRYAPDWIIVGGESGANARPMQLEWARSMKRQSAELDRVFNFKQVGGRGADKGGHALDGVTYFDRPASRIEARSDETPQEVRPEGQEPDPKGTPNLHSHAEAKQPALSTGPTPTGNSCKKCTGSPTPSGVGPTSSTGAE